MSLAGVVVATLIALVGPIPAAALAPGASGLIAFISSRDNQGDGYDIYVMNADGSNQIDLTDNPAYDAQPFWGVLAAAQTATTTTLDVTPASPAAVNTMQTLTATVTPPAAASSVQFRDGTSTIGNPVTVTNGTATRSTTLLPGTHHLSAVFTSTDPTRFSPSTSTEVSYVVETATAAASTATLAAFPTFAFQSLPIVFVAQVAPPAAAGTVQIMDGTTPLGAPVPVFAGFALLVRTLPPGMHTLTAAFTPTNPGAIAPSTSAPVSLTVAGFG